MRWSGWIVTGGLLLAGCFGLRLLSSFFAGHLEPDWPVITGSVALMMTMGAVYLVLPGLIRRTPPAIPLILIVIAAGLVMRLMFLGSAPIMEDDHYRYLWDGAVVAEGHNPFRYTPDQAISNPDLPLHDLAGEAGLVAERINHPQYRTIYPTIAQAAFGFAHLLGPFDIDAWRLVLLAGELVGLALIVVTLRQLDLAPLWAVLYWWNPLVVKELANSAHMDGLLVPLLAAALWAAVRFRWVMSAAFLGLAAGIKVWPVLLLPTVLRPLVAQPAKLAIAIIVLAAIAVAVAWPILSAGFAPSSGLAVYARSWQMNDAAFSLVLALAEILWQPASAQAAARVVVVLILAALMLALARMPARDGHDIARHALIVTAALFLLSPTGFPWYAIWFVPFLVFRPLAPLLLLTALLPLYYLRFALSAEGLAPVFDHYVVWLEFGPVWLWLGAMALQHRRLEPAGQA